MKIEICDNTFWLAIWSVICAAIVSMVFFAISTYTERIKTAIASGYQESQMVGSPSTIWVKVPTSK